MTTTEPMTTTTPPAEPKTNWVERVREPIEIAGLPEWEAGFKADPEAYHKPGVCRYCSGVIPPPYVIESPTKAFKFFVTACEPCVAAGIAKHDAELAKQRMDSMYRFCPPDFAQKWDPNLGNDSLRMEVFKHFSLSAKRGLLLHGASGRCKTRVAWEIIKDVEERPPYEGFAWKFLDGFDLAAKGIPADAYTVPLLIIDDLGNEPPGSKWETGLLHLLRKRCDYHRVTVITTQLQGAQFKARFFQGASGEAILRRLMQHTTAIAA